MPRIENKKLLALADRVENILRSMPPLQTFESRDPAREITALPDLSLEALGRNRTVMNALLAEADGMERASLSSYDELALWQTRYFIQHLMFPVSPLLEEAYWLLFEVTPYRSPLFFAWDKLGSVSPDTKEGVQKRLALGADFVRYTKGIRDKLLEQARRGIYLFSFAIDPSVQMLRSYADVTGPAHPLSLEAPGCAAATAQIAEMNAYIRLSGDCIRETADFLGGADYRRQAPNRPGWSQYPGGQAFYDYQRAFHLGAPMSSEALNALGWKYLEENNQAQRRIREGLGFSGSHGAFLESLKDNDRAYPRSPEQLGAIMNDFNRRVGGRMGGYFEKQALSPCCAKRVSPMLEAAMTFGYFGLEPRENGGAEGVYYYNGSGLDGNKLQITAASLIAHELQPGHHYQECLVAQNDALHPLFKRFGNTGYGDGWAEYAATLAGEMGLYDDLDEYGRLEGDKFLCVRLITDTGMNALGYSLEEAQRIMTEESYATRDMAQAETVRYSACIPGQCLPYKIGKVKLLELRERYRRLTGPAFDLKRFHSLVLDVGNVPLPMLERYLEREALHTAEGGRPCTGSL